MLDQTRLRIAIQKKGRLSDESQKLLQKCGIKFNVREHRLIAFAENMPIDILLVRDDDIPGLIMDDIADIGIIGENVLEEVLLDRQAKGQYAAYHLLKYMDFGACRLSIATPLNFDYQGPQSLANMRIATSYPQLLTRYLTKQNIPFKCCLLNGAVEIAPRAGIADMICDIVSSGTTLEANGLKEVDVIYRSKACLIQRQSPLNADKQAIVERLISRIQGMIQARESKYIMLHAPKEQLDAIITLLPGAERPTIIPLANDTHRVAMHMVSSENLFWETMEQLKQLGASSILVLPIEKMLE